SAAGAGRGSSPPAPAAAAGTPAEAGAGAGAPAEAATSAGLVLHGYHWPLDVVAGWCLSGVLLLAMRAVTRSGQLPK
ncbi:hypothetical protein ACFW1X_33330, partial [[Kitasatospora] papulosa]